MHGAETRAGANMAAPSVPAEETGALVVLDVGRHAQEVTGLDEESVAEESRRSLHPCFARQHFLCFFPLPHGHGSFRPTFGVAFTT